MRIDRRAFMAGVGGAAMGGRALADAPPSGRLSNPNASERARRLYAYLNAVSGHKTLTGQMESAWRGDPRLELDYIQKSSGKLPAILGLDYLNPADNDNVNDRASRWYLEEGGIPTLCWHWGAPDVGPGYVNSKHPFDVPAALTDGTPQNRAMRRDLDDIASKLDVLKARGVPVLWRPFHEFTGTWFWWGQHGPDGFKALWRMMYDHFTRERGLDNLIWVLGYTKDVRADYNPGRAWFDIAGADDYVHDHGPLKDMYDRVEAVVGPHTPIALHENGPIPDPALVERSGAQWLYFLTWHTKWIEDPVLNPPEWVNAVYNSDRYLTKDELPDLKTYPLS